MLIHGLPALVKSAKTCSLISSGFSLSADFLCCLLNIFSGTVLEPPEADQNSSIIFFQSLDELDDDDAAEKNRKEEEEELVQANTFQNEAMAADPATGHLMVRNYKTGGRRTELHICSHL